MNMLRNDEEKQEILNRLEPTRVIKNCISVEMMDMLRGVYASSEKNFKNTGPITVDYFPRKPPYEDWWLTVDKLITPYIGKHSTFTTNFYEVEYPHILHNDDSIALKPRLHKTVVIPLEISEPTEFAIFDQCYLDGPVKLRHGGTPKNKNHDKTTTYYNTDITDNSKLINYTGKDFDPELWEDKFTHYGIEKFHGLSIESIVKWNPGDIIIFDTARIHCATDFRKQGIKRKLGYSIFTHKEE